MTKTMANENVSILKADVKPVNMLWSCKSLVLNHRFSQTGNNFLIRAEGGWEQLGRMREALLKIPGISDVEAYQQMNASEKQKELELESVVCSIENLNSFPVVKELIAIGELNVFGAWFDISTGELMTCNAKQNTWRLEQ